MFGFASRDTLIMTAMVTTVLAAMKATMGTMTMVMALRLVSHALLVLCGVSAAYAGFRSPESLVRNVYAYYGDRRSSLSNGLPHDAETAQQFFDASVPIPKFVSFCGATFRTSEAKGH
jgi:hypothetical protein